LQLTVAVLGGDEMGLVAEVADRRRPSLPGGDEMGLVAEVADRS